MLFFPNSFGTFVGLDTQASDHEPARKKKKKKSGTVPFDFKLIQGLSPLAQESREKRLVPARTGQYDSTGRASKRKRTNTAMKPAIFKVLEPWLKENRAGFGSCGFR